MHQYVNQSTEFYCSRSQLISLQPSAVYFTLLQYLAAGLFLVVIDAALLVTLQTLAIRCTGGICYVKFTVVGAGTLECCSQRLAGLIFTALA